MPLSPPPLYDNEWKCKLKEMAVKFVIGKAVPVGTFWKTWKGINYFTDKMFCCPSWLDFPPFALAVSNLTVKSYNLTGVLKFYIAWILGRFSMWWSDCLIVSKGYLSKVLRNFRGYLCATKMSGSALKMFLKQLSREFRAKEKLGCVLNSLYRFTTSPERRQRVWGVIAGGCSNCWNHQSTGNMSPSGTLFRGSCMKSIFMKIHVHMKLPYTRSHPWSTVSIVYADMRRPLTWPDTWYF